MTQKEVLRYLHNLKWVLAKWWEHDYQGIPLCRVCDNCRETKLARYRPEILTGYDQGDVDEAIEAEE